MKGVAKNEHWRTEGRSFARVTLLCQVTLEYKALEGICLVDCELCP